MGAAIGALKDRKGSSRQAILKYIIANYKVGTDSKIVNSRLKITLKNGEKKGAIKHAKGVGATGSFKLGEQPKPKKAPKKKAVKKPAKKPAAKKAKSPAKKAAKKPAAKKAKSPAKKAAAKKAAKSPAKKAPAKKPAAKKPAAKKAA